MGIVFSFLAENPPARPSAWGPSLPQGFMVLFEPCWFLSPSATTCRQTYHILGTDCFLGDFVSFMFSLFYITEFFQAKLQLLGNETNNKILLIYFNQPYCFNKYSLNYGNFKKNHIAFELKLFCKKIRLLIMGEEARNNFILTLKHSQI